MTRRWSRRRRLGTGTIYWISSLTLRRVDPLVWRRDVLHRAHGRVAAAGAAQPGDPLGTGHEWSDVRDEEDRDQESGDTGPDDDGHPEEPHEHRVHADRASRQSAQLQAAGREQDEER